MNTSLFVLPFMLAMVVAIAGMPTQVFKVCAWNIGFTELEPWRRRTSAAVTRAAQSIRACFAFLLSPRGAFACAAAMLALLLIAGLIDVGHGSVLFAVAPVAATRNKRAKLMREAQGLKRADGSFENDEKRARFDAILAEVETLDGVTRAAGSGQSETLVERNPLDPGAPITAAQRQAQDDADEDDEPNELDAVREAETARCQGILTGCRAARLPQSFADKLIGENVSLVEAQTRILTELGKRDGQGTRPGSGPTVAIVGEDPLVHVRAGIENALLHRVQPNWFKLEDVGRQYRGLTLLDTARLYLQARGIRTTGLSKMELAGMALGLDTRGGGLHTATDFANLLADAANKTLRRAFEEAPQTFSAITRQTTIPDFKMAKRLQIGEAPSLLSIDDDGEFTRGTIGEGKEQYQLATYGRIFGISRKSLINDDTDAFSRIPMLFGRSARNLESNLVWTQILSNPNMADAVALFHATHANLSGTSDAISVASIGAGRASMRKQTGIDGATLINVNPLYLIVPPSKETLADQFVSTNLLASQSSSVNPFAGRLTVISEPRLEVGIGAVSGSNVSWYLAASPDQIDVLEIAYLEGENGPVTESRIGFDVDGLEIKCRHDVGAKVIDFRGLYKNPGA
jgi:hypothetical protein